MARLGSNKGDSSGGSSSDSHPLPGARSTGYIFKAILFLFIVAVGYLIWFASAHPANEFYSVKQAMANSRAEWADALLAEHEDLRDWLVNHGTTSEVAIFDEVAHIVFRNSLSLANNFRNLREGVTGSLYAGLHGAVIRGVFMFLAVWRLVAAVLLVSSIIGWRKIKPYIADTLLGQMGNGRVFFSGILGKLDSKGHPSVQVVGLACPASASRQETTASSLARILDSFSATNETNLSLAGIVLQHRNFPGFVVPSEESRLLEQSSGPGTLFDQAELSLRETLAAHSRLTAEEVSGQKNSERAAALLRVLTRKQAEVVAKIPSSAIATIVLALEAGKVLAYAREDGAWVRKSSFPELCARAVMHSVVHFAKEHSFEERNILRRALVYGQRQSVMAPVALPVDLGIEARALRQWVEVLMAPLYEVATVGDEVQLHGLVHELHLQWQQGMFDAFMIQDPKILGQAFSTPGNLFVVPLRSVVEIIRRTVSFESLGELERLTGLVSQKQKLRNFSAESGGPKSVPSYSRVIPPLNLTELKGLAEGHRLSIEDLRIWSAFRTVLSQNGWLARRMGDLSVPDSQVVFAVVEVGKEHPDSNHLGLLGLTGAVPLRGTRLQDKWGEGWRSRLVMGSRANMAEERIDFENMMLGVMKQDLPEMTTVIGG